MGEARAALERAVGEDPDAGEARSHLGIVLALAGDSKGAEEAFREAIRLQPELVEARTNLGNLLSAAGDLAGARAQFAAAVRTRPADASTHYHYAMALGRGRLFDEAQRELETAVRADAGHTGARERLAELLLAKGDARAAAGHYRELVRLRKVEKDELWLGAALAMSGDVAGALPYLRKVAASKDAELRGQAVEMLRQVEQRR
jgi:Flp pilus assembly protein TadD